MDPFKEGFLLGSESNRGQLWSVTSDLRLYIIDGVNEECWCNLVPLIIEGRMATSLTFSLFIERVPIFTSSNV